MKLTLVVLLHSANLSLKPSERHPFSNGYYVCHHARLLFYGFTPTGFNSNTVIVENLDDEYKTILTLQGQVTFDLPDNALELISVPHQVARYNIPSNIWQVVRNLD